jgi:hypothetical protein
MHRHRHRRGVLAVSYAGGVGGEAGVCAAAAASAAAAAAALAVSCGDLRYAATIVQMNPFAPMSQCRTSGGAKVSSSAKTTSPAMSTAAIGGVMKALILSSMR